MKYNKQTTNEASIVEDATTHSQPKEPYKLSSIIITGIINQEYVTALTNQAVGNEHFQTKLMSNGNNKINIFSDYAYRVSTDETKKYNISRYSYENKQNVGNRVIKNLHYSFQPTNIMNSFRAQGVQELSATLKLKWLSKNSIDIFVVPFYKNDNINKIYNIRVCNAALPKCKLTSDCNRPENV